ncbi:amino acid permease [Patescibacteria group bacterium]|nr:amino acid permease [Patescibacteria group bacterium]
MNNSFVLALSTLIGTIIGAGIFGLPFVISKSGIIPGLFYLLILGGAVTLLHLFIGEIALRTSEKHRLIGYAGIYLGNWGKGLATISTFVGTIGALLAYIIIGGIFLQKVVSPFVPISEMTLSLLFWAGLSLFILRGIQLITKAEFVMNIALFSVIAVVFIFAFPHVKTQNFQLFDASNIMLPFGVVLFALAGWSAIPEIADLFKKRKERKNLDNLIVWSSIIVIGLYALFTFFVVGVSGGDTSPDAIAGLEPLLGGNIVILGALFGLIAIAASFLVLGNYLKNSLRYDFHFPYFPAAFIAIFVPLLLFLAGFQDFITVIGLVGVFIGVVEGILIVLIFQKAKKKGDRKPEYNVSLPPVFLVALVGILIAGAVAEVIL